MQSYFSKAVWRIGMAVCVLLALTVFAYAAEGQSIGSSVYCFGESQFQDEDVTGIFVLSVPDKSIGTIYYGQRVIRSGDVLSRDAMSALTLKTCSCVEGQAVMTYLPVYGSRLGEDARLSIDVHSGKAGVPVAKDLKLETYKNIANDGVLQATDDGAVTFDIIEQPKLGSVELMEDGKFIYTPEKNKVGNDQFTYTAKDDNGNTSKPATVRIEILKPTDQTTYSDMAQDTGAFEAMWLREKNMFSGSVIGGQLCFVPDNQVSRGEFLVMAMKMLNDAPETTLKSGFADENEAPQWMRPYLASAMRHGYIKGFSDGNRLVFRPNDQITHAAAAVMLQRMLNLEQASTTEVFMDAEAAPAWAQSALATLASYNLPTGYAPTEPMTRLEAAKLLYEASAYLK